MSRNIVFVLTYHHHKLLDLIHIFYSQLMLLIAQEDFITFTYCKSVNEVL